MGYTHYFYRPTHLNKTGFAQAAADCAKVVKAADIPIQYEYDQAKPACFIDNLIWFNGVGDDGHETFAIPQILTPESWSNPDEKGQYFNFCKTAQKPYDLCVTACLIILKHYFGNDFKVSSDGEQEDWVPAINLVQATLGYGEDFKIHDKDEVV